MTTREPDAPEPDRRDGWEYLLFLDELLTGLDGYESARKDYDIGFAQPGDRFIDFDDIVQDVQIRTHQATRIASVVEQVLNPDVLGRAFGAPGEPGDEDAIRHAALQVVEVYSNLLAWAASVRGVHVPNEARSVYDALAEYVALPLEQIRNFVSDLDAALRPAVAALRAHEAPNEQVVIRMTLNLSIDERAVQAFQDAHAEFLRHVGLPKR